MAVTLAQAKPLCTASELELVRASMKRATSDMTPAQLRQKLTRARRLRDKFRDVGDRQRRESRGKQDARRSRPASGNRGTRLKQQLFSETVERLEQALQQAEGAAQANGPSPRKKTSKKAGRKAAGAGSTAARGGRKTSKKAARKKAAATPATPTKKTGKKARKKAAKKTAKKAGRKKVARKKASSLRASAGAAGSGRGTSPAASSRGAVEARNESLQSISEQSIGAREARRLDRAGQPRLRGHVSARTRRAQARRDSR